MKKEVTGRIKQILSDAELRKTRHRVNILGVLLKAKKPLTEQEIARRLPRPRPNKVTVYRCLEKFVTADVVHRAYLKERSRHYELSDNCTARQCHPHFTCTSCGITRCMTGLKVPLVRGLGKGFMVHRQQVRLEGLCPRCAK